MLCPAQAGIFLSGSVFGPSERFLVVSAVFSRNSVRLRLVGQKTTNQPVQLDKALLYVKKYGNV